MLSQIPVIGLIGTNKDIRLINKRIGKNQRESQRLLPNKLEIYRRLLRNEVKNTDGAKQRGNCMGKVTGLVPGRWKSLDGN